MVALRKTENYDPAASNLYSKGNLRLETRGAMPNYEIKCLFREPEIKLVTWEIVILGIHYLLLNFHTKLVDFLFFFYKSTF